MADEISQPLPPETPAADTAAGTPASSAVAPDAGTPPPSAPAAVNVLNPEGALVSIPPEQLQDALASGYQQATPEDVQKYSHEQKYGTVGQQAKTFLEGAGQAATFGLSTGLEKGLGVKAEDIRGREEENPVAHGLGELTGLGASALIPGVGEANVLNDAGHLASEAAGLAEAATLGQQVAKHAVEGAMQGALMQGGQEVSKAFAENPDQTAETSIVDLGLATIMGGVFGGALGAAYAKLSPAKLAEQASMETAEKGANEMAQPFVSELDKPALEAGDFETSVKHSDLPEKEKSGVLTSLRKQKDVAPELRKIGEKYELPVLEGMTSDSQSVQKAENALLKGPPTIASLGRQKLYNEAYEKASGILDSVTGGERTMSKAEAGESLQKSILEKLEERYAPTQKLYEDLKEVHSEIPVTQNDITELKTNIQNLKELQQTPHSPQGRFLRNAMRNLENAKTVDDLKVQQKAALEGVNKLIPAERRMAAILVDQMEDTQEKAIERMARAQRTIVPARSKVAEAVGAGAMDDVGGVGTFREQLGSMQGAANETLANIERQKVAKAQYKSFMKEIGELSEQLGKGKVYGPKHAMEFIRDLDPETVTQRLLAKNSSKFLASFSKKFPEEMETLRTYQKGLLREQASKAKDGFNPTNYFKSVNGLEKEYKNALFNPEEQRKLSDLQTYFNNFPKEFNPSGTDHTSAFRAFFEHPTGAAVANLRDFGIERFIKYAAASPEANAAQKLGKATVAGWKATDKGVKGVFSKETGEAVSKPSETSREKIKTLVDKYLQNPQSMLDIGKNNPIPAYATVFAQTTAKAVEYLSGLRPNTSPDSPLDNKKTPSKVETAAYNRQVDLAQRPSLILQHIKSGSISPQDITTVKTIYPNYYNLLTQKLTDKIIDAKSKEQLIPYKTKMSLSLFMGQPLDSTMSPGAIQSIQSVFAPRQAPDQGQGAPQPKHSTNSLNKLAPSYQTATQAAESRRAKP